MADFDLGGLARGVVNDVARRATRDVVGNIAGNGHRDPPRAEANRHLDGPSSSKNLRPERPSLSKGESLSHYRGELQKYNDELTKLSKDPSFKDILSRNPESRKRFEADKSFGEKELRRVENDLKSNRQEPSSDRSGAGGVVDGIKRKVVQKIPGVLEGVIRGALR